MRKTMFLFVLLLAVSIGVIFYAHITLSAAHENVSFTEVASFGDISAADGLTVSVQAHMEGHLFWDSVHAFGETPDTQTDFRFSSRQVWDWVPPGAPDAINLSIPHSTSFATISHMGCLLYQSEEIVVIGGRDFTFIESILRDVASRTQDGQRHYEHIRVRDYFDYYPISAHISPEFVFLFEYLRAEDGDGYVWRSFASFEDSAELNEVFSSFFRLPVLEDHTIAIGIGKDRAGNVVEHSVTSNTWLRLQASGVVTEDGIYFVVWSDDVTDFSNISGGFGIYLLPSAALIADEGVFVRTHYTPSTPALIADESDGNEILTLDIRNLSTVFPLCESATALNLNLSNDESALYLLSIENETLFLTVIDIATMTERQKLPLLDNVSDNWFQNMQFEDGILFVVLWDGRFVLTEKGCDNIYQIALTGARNENLLNHDTSESMHGIWGEQLFSWDGERLALVTTTTRMLTSPYGWESRHETRGFALEIFDSSGLRYMGIFDNSLDVLAGHGRILIGTRGFSLSWGD